MLSFAREMPPGRGKEEGYLPTRKKVERGSFARAGLTKRFRIRPFRGTVYHRWEFFKARSIDPAARDIRKMKKITVVLPGAKGREPIHLFQK